MNAILVALAMSGAVEEHRNPPMFFIEVAVFTGDPLGSRKDGTIKSLAEPNLTTINARPATFFSRSSADSNEAARVGVELKFLVSARFRDTAHLDFASVLTRRTTDGTGDRQRRDAVELTRIVKYGETTRIRLGADSPESQTWAEVRVTRIARER